jgi:hypothetical protein
MQYLREFIIASSPLTTFPFYYLVANYAPKKNYSYELYTFLAPLWFGVWNIIANNFNLSLKSRYILISTLSISSIIIIAKQYNAYTFDDEEWNKYCFYIVILYSITWYIIYKLQKLFS